MAEDPATRPSTRWASRLTAPFRAWRGVPFLLALCLVTVQISVIMARNGGHLTYSLDDPYIHLSVSESIAEGHYGIHPRVLSAPSSSILWPFLLAPGASLPMACNPAATAQPAQPCSPRSSCFSRLLRRCGLHRIRGGEAYVAGLLSILVLTLNFTGLALTGMEHSLQVALALALVLGMIAVARDRPTPLYLQGAIILGPLVRYESAALSVAAIMLLLTRGRWRAALLGATGCLVSIGLFSLFLVSLDLEPLPGPVLENIEVTRGMKLKSILSVLPARLLATLTGILLAVALVSRRREATLLLCGAVAPVLHLSFGSFGGFARYEIYILASVVALLVYGLRHTLRRLITARGPAISLLATSAVLVPAFSNYAVIAYLTPQAAHNIHQQHDQMHRFVTEHYRRPVAVNDIGRVSYRNPGYVLDLWGLCSTEMRRARLGQDPAWPDAFVQREGVDLAMIYDSWFIERIPPTWRLIARLHLRGKRITPGAATVSFYLTRSGPADEILEQLRAFRADLPSDANLTIESLSAPGRS